MNYKARHFSLQEIVCPHIFQTYGSRAWSFFDERILMTIDFLRDQFDVPIYVNNYDMPDDTRKKLGFELYDERGIRCIFCDLVKKAIKKNVLYCSAHIRAQALDFNVHNMKPDKVSLWAVSNYQLLPFPIRIEKGTNGWTHIDVCNQGTNKVETFITKN